MKKIHEFVKQHCFIGRLLLLALAYFATGKLGLFLAIPPGYATAIYPPSGIALAGILLLGYRAWFGVLLGSFLMNLSIAASHAPIENYIPVVVALIIAIGATLQALTGTYLVKRFGDFPNPLASEKSVFKFMFYGGVLSTLVNSTISVSTLVAMNQIPLSNFFTNWTTWWLGDAIGVFIFTPLTLVWLYQKHDYFRNRKQLITATILATFSLTVMFVVLETHKETKYLKSEFDKDARSLNVALDKSITAHLTVLRSLENLYAASINVEREEFQEFTTQALADFKGIQALEWCPIVTHLQRDDFEKSVQKEGITNFEIKERDENQKLIRATQREYYVPVTFVEPFKGNEPALGYDLNSKERRETLANARDTGEIATTSKITLVQDNQTGILVIAPIYKNHFPHQSLEERRQNILGYVQIVFHIHDIFNTALVHTHFEKLHLQLFDENAPIPQRLLFSNQSKPFVLNEKGLFGKNISLMSSTLISMGNRQWRFEITPTQDYFVYHYSDNAWLILLTGLILTSMMGVFIMVSSGRDMVLQELVNERTNALAKSETHFRSIIEISPIPLALNDNQQNILFLNPAFISTFGYDLNDIPTLNAWWEKAYPDVNYRQWVLDSWATTLKQCESENKAFTPMELIICCKNGRQRTVLVSAAAIADSFDFHLVMLYDITERKSIEQELKASEFRWKFAVEGSGDGLWDWDIANANHSVFFSNRWKEMLGFNDDELKNDFEEWASRIHSDDKANVFVTVQDYLNDKTPVYLCEHRLLCKDGTYKWILARGAIVDRDEQGKPARMIGTHTDITERKKTEAELKRSNADLEQFAYAVSHDMRQPLRMVTSYLTLIEKALQTQLDEDTRQFLTFALDGAKRMDSMILSLLDYSRVGRQSQKFSVISSRVAVDEALSFLKPMLDACGGEVNVSGDWVDLVANNDELMRLFQNLIGNALKYHDENKPPHVDVSASITSNTFRVEVRDNGIGIAPSQIDRLFKVFSRLQARSRFEGTGVGLALCRKIVEHHGGEIGAKSEGEGLGCTFWFELPRDNKKLNLDA